jgi:serine/threonine protein kinase
MSVRRRFRIIKEIAEGGFGKVYLAEQISADGFSRIVAMKLLHAKWSTHDEIVMRTRDEARLLGLIRHQHIVKVEDLSSLDGKCAILMEYLEGVDLKWMMQFLKERNEVFPRAALFEIVLAAASALDAAYNSVPLQGGQPLKVIHRDIKPSNVFVTTNGAVKVLDFGTARANFAEREAKTQALAFGSQGYMAPERMLGEEDSPKGDIFSLGISLYELLTLDSFGRIPPRPNKFAQKLDERIAAVPLEGDADWCAAVRKILREMLAYDPNDRPTAAQIVEVMEGLAQDAKDTGLRKFCRTSVAEAKAALPELETGDPLVGNTIEEDASGVIPRSDIAGRPDGPASPGASGSFRRGQTGPLSLGPGIGSPDISGASAISPRGEEAAPAEAGGGRGVVVGLGFAAVVLLLLGGLGVVAVFAGGLYMASAPAEVATAPVPASPKPTAEAPKSPPAVSGGQVVTPDRRPEGAKAKVTLEVTGSKVDKVVVSGGEGFKGEWDGKAPWTVGLGDGRYATNVEMGGEKVRGLSFTVDPGAKTCAFQLNLAARAWSGNCR